LEYDDFLHAALQSVLNVSISDEVRSQATLPVANGGIGMRMGRHKVPYQPSCLQLLSPHVQMPFSTAQKNWDKDLVDIQEKMV
jgi:hypothetical protein